MFITITGISHYYGETPFKIGTIVSLKKDLDNEYDSEAIKVELPCIGKVGYVANNYKTIAKGTMSAGRIYDKIGTAAFAKVMFICEKSVIAEVVNCGIERGIWENVFEDVTIKWNES